MEASDGPTCTVEVTATTVADALARAGLDTTLFSAMGLLVDGRAEPEPAGDGRSLSTGRRLAMSMLTVAEMLGAAVSVDTTDMDSTTTVPDRVEVRVGIDVTGSLAAIDEPSLVIGAYENDGTTSPELEKS